MIWEKVAPNAVKMAMDMVADCPELKDKLQELPVATQHAVGGYSSDWVSLLSSQLIPLPPHLLFLTKSC